ncbi:hypothetical protein [Kineococcus rhizosphaerae]|uniref:AraC-like protein n=1 Tax=Kineococcus rhizosphaerae TaxID=559628 RepID=A0A2T0R3B7_9ACTN|nr:hypothetical protein [Kineococcus rhizosphaerae]PRY14536.1 AraC-like protein [Kineococcus rhizosphaerae]
MAVEVLEVSTREPDVAHSMLSEVYCPENPIAFSRPGDRFLCEFRAASSGDLGADRVRFTTGMRAELAPMDSFLVAAGVRGSSRYAVGREQVDMRPGVVFRYPTDAAISSWWQDTQAVTVRVPLSLVERIVEERFGTAPHGLRFEGLTPVSEPARRSWLRLMRFVRDHLDDPVAGGTRW